MREAAVDRNERRFTPQEFNLERNRSQRVRSCEQLTFCGGTGKSEVACDAFIRRFPRDRCTGEGTVSAEFQDFGGPADWIGNNGDALLKRMS